MILEVEPKEAIIRLAEDVTGVLKASEISIDRIEDARNVLTVGEEVEVKIVSVDRKNRNLGLSIKAKEVDDEREAVREHRREWWLCGQPIRSVPCAEACRGGSGTTPGTIRYSRGG